MEISSFSSTGDTLSACGSDGRLRIWETKDKNCVFKQEFVPSTHLTATFTSIQWAPAASTPAVKVRGVVQRITEHLKKINDRIVIAFQGQKKKKKRTFEGDLVAIGTSAGSLFLYSFAKSQLVAHSAEVHAGAITGLTWNPVTLALYSCGEDGFIVEWDVENVKSVR